MESKVRPERVQLTWDEIRAIESKWKHLPAYEDVRKLTRHIRFTACLRDQEKLPDTHVLEKERLEHPYTMVCSNCQCGLTWHTRRPVTKCPECGAPPMKDAEGDNHGA